MARYKAKTGWERAVQVLRWLIDEFKLPDDIRIELVPHIDGPHVLGCVVERNGRLVILISRKMNRTVSQMVETTMHEAAHAKLTGAGLGDYHGPKFWELFGRMSDAFDHHGHADSRSYPVD